MANASVGVSEKNSLPVPVHTRNDDNLRCTLRSKYPLPGNTARSFIVNVWDSCRSRLLRSGLDEEPIFTIPNASDRSMMYKSDMLGTIYIVCDDMPSDHIIYPYLSTERG